MSPGEVEDLKNEVRDLRTDVDKLKRFQSYIWGACAAIGSMLLVFGDFLKRKLGL